MKKAKTNLAGQPEWRIKLSRTLDDVHFVIGHIEVLILRLFVFGSLLYVLFTIFRNH